MRDIRRRPATERPRLSLRRAADGRLKPADNADIADIWAEQKRIQLRDAIANEQRRALKKQRRKERGLFGWARLAAKPQGHTTAAQTQATHPAQQPSMHGRSSNAEQGGPKEIEIRLHLPKIHLPHPADVAAQAQRLLAPVLRSRRAMIAVVATVIVLLGFVGSKAFGAHQHAANKTAKNTTKTAVLSTNVAQKPDFPTVLPVGKKIEDLGGWGRVSPPDRDPVFAYSDTLGGVHIVVSEQTLPNSFTDDLNAQLAKVAKQFNASKKLTTAEGSNLYLGTAPNGAQSVITSKNGLLILIRATSNLSDQLWSDYVYALE